MWISASEVYYIGWTGASVVPPTLAILKYLSIEITGSELGLCIIWTLFLSDSSWQIVGVGLGLQDLYPNFHGRSHWGMKGVVGLFLHFCNRSLDKGLSFWRFSIWLLALKIPGDPHCALQRPKYRYIQRAYPSNTQNFSTCHQYLSRDGGQKAFPDLQYENSASWFPSIINIPLSFVFG